MAGNSMFSLGASIADLIGGGPGRRAEDEYVPQINKNAVAAGNWQEAVKKRAMNTARASITPELMQQLGYAATEAQAIAPLLLANETVNLGNLGKHQLPGFGEAAGIQRESLLGDVVDVPRANRAVAFMEGREYQPVRIQDGHALPDGGSLADVAAQAMMLPGKAASLAKLESDDAGNLYQIGPDGRGRAVQFGGETMPAGPVTGGGAAVLEDAISSVIGPLGGRITSTTGGRHNPGSKHYSGGAIDVGMARESPQQQAQILAALQAIPGIRVRDERTRPPGQAVWSGPHLHVERIGDIPAQVAQAGGAPRFTNKGRSSSGGASYSPLSAGEVTALGLPTGTVAQRNEKTGQVSILSKPDARTGAGGGQDPLPAGEAGKVRTRHRELRETLDTFKAFDQALTDIPNGPGIAFDGAAKGRLGTAYNNARAQLRVLYNTGVLQPGELPMLENALRDPTSTAALVDPRTRSQLRSQLDELYHLTEKAFDSLVTSYPQMYDAERYESEKGAALGRPALGQEAMAPRRLKFNPATGRVE
jgi:hypothetical protein